MRPLPVYRPKAKAAGAPIRVRRPPVLFRPSPLQIIPF